MYCGNFIYGETQTIVNNVNSVEQCYMPPVGIWSDGINPCIPDWTFGGSNIERGDCYYFPDDPPPPLPNDPDGGSTSGDNGTVTNPVNPLELVNHVTDSCLKKTVNRILNSNVTGKIAEIIKSLDKKTNVTINIYDSDNTINNKAGQTTGTKWQPVPNKPDDFSTNITLSKSHLLNSSQEYVAAVVIHEILHAYFREKTGNKEILDGLDHEDMARYYVGAIAEFLHDLYNIDMIDAYAIAWEGASDTKIYRELNSLEISRDDESITTMSKSDLSMIATKYLAKIEGKPLCQK